MTTLKAGEDVKLVAVIRIEYSANPAHYFDDLEGRTADEMAALDWDAVNENSAVLDDLLAGADDVVVHIYPELEEDD